MLAATIMLVTLFGLIAAVYALVLRYDPQAHAPSHRPGAKSCMN